MTAGEIAVPEKRKAMRDIRQSDSGPPRSAASWFVAAIGGLERAAAWTPDLSSPGMGVISAAAPVSDATIRGPERGRQDGPYRRAGLETQDTYRSRKRADSFSSPRFSGPGVGPAHQDPYRSGRWTTRVPPSAVQGSCDGRRLGLLGGLVLVLGDEGTHAQGGDDEAVSRSLAVTLRMVTRATPNSPSIWTSEMRY